jgi:dephospho-CoA kinase
MRCKLGARHGNVIGLTGNIASGKSLALAVFKKSGFLTFSLDNYVHKIMNENYSLKEKICIKFPNCVINGNISRSILGDIVFNNKSDMISLEEIIAPYTKKRIEEIHNMINKNKYRSAVVEIPLLFEKNREKYFDKIIYLYSSTKTMLKRSLNRNNMNRKRFFGILENQYNKEEVINKVDFLIYNENKHYLFKYLKQIIQYGRFKRSYIRH